MSAGARALLSEARLGRLTRLRAPPHRAGFGLQEVDGSGGSGCDATRKLHVHRIRR